jgi:hypothetical protein
MGSLYGTPSYNDEPDNGWRCVATRNLNNSSTWMRHNGDVPETAPVPVNSNYAPVLLILVLGNSGFVAIRRYN